MRPVDLVHFPGGTVAHHQRAAVHRPRQPALRTHDLFAFVLGVLGDEIWVLAILRFVKHVLTKQAFVHAQGRNRTHEVKLPLLNGRCGQRQLLAGKVAKHPPHAYGADAKNWREPATCFRFPCGSANEIGRAHV